MTMTMSPASTRRTLTRLNYAAHGGGLGVAVGIIGLWYAASSGLNQYRERLVVECKEAEDVSRGDAEARRRHAELMSRLSDVRRRNDELRDRLTSSADETRFVVQLSDAATATNVELGGIHPGQKSTREGIGQLPLSLRCDGSFSSMATFLDAIQKLPRVCHLASLKVSAEEGTSALRGDLGLLLLYGRLPTGERP
jgi:Tfp pilus assembly protein PilO